MIDIIDRSYMPSIPNIADFIHNPLFYELLDYMNTEYKALYSLEYSGDQVLPGWNIKFYKAGRTLCRLYPKRGFFTLLIVVGHKEKESVEFLLPEMSDRIKQIYHDTKEGMG